MFTVEVVDENMAEGSNTLVNWGLVGVGAKTQHDEAIVYIQNDKEFVIKITVLIILFIICLIIIAIFLHKIYCWKRTQRRERLSYMLYFHILFICKLVHL